MKRILFLIYTSLLGGPSAFSEVKLPPLISDGMVLQVPNARIWGSASPGEKVAVAFGNVSAVAIATVQGEWEVELTGLQSGTATDLVIEGKNRLVVKDVLAGEVWLASGQSNMALAMQAMPDFQKFKDEVSLPQIRMFLVAKHGWREPKPEARGRWVSCSPKDLGTWSAAGFFFARDLHTALGSPIGIINASVGNTEANAWTPYPILHGDALFKSTYLAPWTQKMERYPSEMAQYEKELAAWNSSNAEAEKEGKPHPPAKTKPRIPQGPDSHKAPAALYNAMIHGLGPYTIKGSVWYQGESDIHTPDTYRRLLPAMIASWRELWGYPFPFLIVQLPNFQPRKVNSEIPQWAVFREVQAKISKEISYSGLCVTIDIGEAENIHPLNKSELGRRLSLLAQAVVYHQKIPYIGPIMHSVKYSGPYAFVHFKELSADGLKLSEGASIRGFFLAGSDQKFHQASAEIERNASGEITIKLHSTNVKIPIAVRYAWEDNPKVNLVNQQDLPAQPFRTDRW